MRRRGFLGSLVGIFTVLRSRSTAAPIEIKGTTFPHYTGGEDFDLFPVDVYTREPKYINEDGSDGGTRRRVDGQA